MVALGWLVGLVKSVLARSAAFQRMSDVPITISTETNSSSDAVMAAPAHVSNTPSSSGVGIATSGHHHSPCRNVVVSPGALERGEVPVLPVAHSQGGSIPEDVFPAQIMYPVGPGPSQSPGSSTAHDPRVSHQSEGVAFVDARTLHSQSSQNQANTYVDARQVDISLQVQGVDPLVHQQVVSGVLQHAHSQHSQILHEHANAFQQSLCGVVETAQSRHNQIVSEQSGACQQNLSQVLETAESRHNQVVGSIQSRHVEDMNLAQSRHDAILHEAEQRVQQLVAQQREVFERDRRDLMTQLIQMTQERDQLRQRNSELSQSIRESASAAHSAPANPAPGTSSAAHSAPEASVLPEMRIRSSPQLHASSVLQPVSVQPELSTIATLQGHIEQLTLKVIDLQSQMSPKRPSKGRRGKSRSPHSSEGSESSLSSEEDEEYELERKRMRIKSYDKLKLPSLPKTASDFRPWRNALFASIAQCSKQSEEHVYGWLHLASGDEDVGTNESFPILSRVLGTKLLELSKGSRFQLEFQSIQEKSRLQKRHPSGLVLLQRITKKFFLEKERGMALNSQHLLALKPAGNEIKDLESFRDKALYVLSGLDEEEQLNEGMLRSWLYEALKKVPAMQLKIEKFREAPPKDPIRTFDWLWSKLGETLDEAQHDTNSSSILSSLTGGRQVPNAAVKKEKDSKKEKDKSNLSSEKKSKKRERQQVAIQRS